MMLFIGRTKPLQNLECLLLGRFLDVHRLKTPLQSRVFFNVLSVFFLRGSADQLQLASCKRRLQDI